MTRSERRRKATRAPSSSSTSTSKAAASKFEVFDFTEADCDTEKAEAKRLRKFLVQTNDHTIQKKKHKKPGISSVTKSKFLKCFTGISRDPQKQGNHDPIDVDAEDTEVARSSQKGVSHDPIDVDAEVTQGNRAKEVSWDAVDVDADVKQAFKISKAEMHCEIVDVDLEAVAQQNLGREVEDFVEKAATDRNANLVSNSSNYGVEPCSVICVTSDNENDGMKSHSLSTSFSLDIDAEVPPEEQSPVYNDGGHKIDITNKKVIVYPDFILCGDHNYKGSRLIFSTSSVKLEGSVLNGTGTTVNFQWTVDEIVSVESTWCERVETAIVNLHFKLRDLTRAGKKDGTDFHMHQGIKGLKFAVYDPQWFEGQSAIKSLAAVYKNIWREIFDIDADETEDSLWRFNALFLSEGPLTYPQELIEVVYPEGKPEGVTVTGRDIELLQPEKFVNDNIIDFYIQYLKSKIQPEKQNRFYFFNCFFFKKLVGLDNNPSTVGKEREAFQCVRKWTKDVNLFQKDYIFIPVNYSLHWSLIIICHPGEMASLKVEEIENSRKVPCILHMDSIRGSHRGLRNPVQSYLCELWKEMHDTSAEDVATKFLRLPFFAPELPQQENSFDCGIFLLHYIERFLEEGPDNFSPSAISKAPKFLRKNWFSPEEASLKRAYIHNLIYNIHENNSQTASSTCCGGKYPLSVVINANKLNNEPEKRNIVTGECHGISVSGSDHGKQDLVLAASYRGSREPGKDSQTPETLKSRISKKICSYETREEEMTISQGNVMLHKKEIEKSGGQDSESTTDAGDCEIIAYSPQDLHCSSYGNDTQQSLRVYVHLKENDDGISYTGTSLGRFQNGYFRPEKSDDITVEETERSLSSSASEEFLDCVVEDSEDQDGAGDGDETESSPFLSRGAHHTPPHVEMTSVDVIDLTADGMLGS